MSKQLNALLTRLKKPSVLMSLASQIISIFILMGYNINENKVMAILTLVCSILVTLGIMHNPDTQKKGYGDDLLTCAADGTRQHHVQVNGRLVCADCGAVYDATKGQSDRSAPVHDDSAADTAPAIPIDPAAVTGDKLVEQALTQAQKNIGQAE